MQSNASGFQAPQKKTWSPIDRMLCAPKVSRLKRGCPALSLEMSRSQSDTQVALHPLINESSTAAEALASQSMASSPSLLRERGARFTVGEALQAPPPGWLPASSQRNVLVAPFAERLLAQQTEQRTATRGLPPPSEGILRKTLAGVSAIAGLGRVQTQALSLPAGRQSMEMSSPGKTSPSPELRHSFLRRGGSRQWTVERGVAMPASLFAPGEAEDEKPLPCGGYRDTQQFLAETRARVRKRQAEHEKVPEGERPVRIAIVGAGPVGLWIAVLLARQHARLFTTQTSVRISKKPLAPEITIFERRTPDGGYGSRRVILAMSPASQNLLNSNMTCGRQQTANHPFSPVCSINLIEACLREELEKYLAAGFGSFRLGEGVEAPEKLLEEFDVVFAATGRRFPDDDWRRSQGMQMRIGQTDEALILKFVREPGTDSVSLADVNSALLSRLDLKGQLSIFLRPGVTEGQGWVWLMGLGCELVSKIRASIESRQNDVAASDSFSAAWSQFSIKAPRDIVGSVTAALAMLDEHLKPAEVAARVTEASFWHSEEIIHRVERADGSEGWLVLAGDAAFGRPFHLGNTLNGHFQHATFLTAAPWTRWFTSERETGTPFRKYVQHYWSRIDAAAGFRCSHQRDRFNCKTA
eukprot:TRINITY_DN27200_c0_g1_i1.p1 TRINITY_DN27200_c0_g1~~TRINITY_DN27200_c0_g1_i1.p1  ORF type:complete len:641 (+),score=122.38 TRINITY_DN27200_c0_g1_i1:161-2083(+)